jgi:hypothetical protein
MKCLSYRAHGEKGNSMKVITYIDWLLAVKEQSAKLRAVMPYLSEDGKERFRAYDTLAQMAVFCEARELVEWIDSKVGLDEDDAANLASRHVAGAIRKLREIAAQA